MECVHSSLQIDAGWSSLAARRAHNPKVAGSNPAPATNLIFLLANQFLADRYLADVIKANASKFR